VALPLTPASPQAAAQARLILQDPNAAIEAKLPALRLSRELRLNPTPAMERATAQQVWQALQLTPDELITQRLQLQDAYTKQDSASAHARAARSEAAKLKTKLKELQDTRWQHPAVYGAGAAFLGLTGLWLWERKKRLAAQHRALQWVAPGAVPATALAQAGAPIIDPIATSISQADLQSYVVPLEASPPAFQRPVPWWQLWSRKKITTAPASAKPLSDSLAPLSPSQWSVHTAVVAPTPGVIPAPQAESSSALIPVKSVDSAPTFISASGGENSIAFDDSHDDYLGMEAPSDDFYSSDIGTLRSYNPMRSKLSDIEDAMGQLLEIRMAVQAMVDLRQLPAAKKLLDNHIDDLPHTSAWAYLVHLDLSSQLGQRDAFEDMRKRYRLQFNRLAPYWREVDAAVQTLDTYTRPMAELCTVWPAPKQARALIATWLLGAQYSRRQFQLPAYYDLLDLYDMLEGMSDDSNSVQPFQPGTASLLDIDFSASSHVHLDLPAQRMAGAHQP
jgi:hypothetical protein